MIAKTLKTLDGKLVVKIPTLLSEVSLGMLINLQGPQKSNIETISILSGVSKDELYNVCNITDIDVFDDHIASLVHKIQYEAPELKVPIEITIAGKCIKVIQNLSIEPVGAFMECRNIIAEEINEHIKLYGENEWKENFQPSLDASAKMLAHYLYCPATGLNYSDEKAMAFTDEVLKMPISEAVPIARFFFVKYPNLWSEKPEYSKAVRQLWRRKLASVILRLSPTTTR